MPIVRTYPIDEVSPQPLPNVAPNVPAAGELALFGGDRARDLQVAGQALGQASDSMFALYERHAQEANETRVQDLNNQFIAKMQDVLRTGPDAFYKRKGADAIQAAGAATEALKKAKAEVFGQAVNGYQRGRLGPILETHLASGTEQIARHVDSQQQVYDRDVADATMKVAEREALSNPDNLPGAATRAAASARMLYKGQAPEVVESESRKAVSQLLSGLIGNLLTENNPAAVGLYRQYQNRLEPQDRRMLGGAVEMLSNTLDAAAWLRERSATLRPPPPTGDAALDAVNAASASTAEPPPVISSGGALLGHDEGIVGTRRRLDEIEERQRALTALNRQEFAANPARLQANQRAIDADTARGRAAVKADTDTVYADLRRHLTTGGPNGGPAVTLPPTSILSRLTEAQRDAVAAQVNAAAEGRRTVSDPRTRYTIRRGLTADDAGERQRWALTSLVPFMGRLSPGDYAGLETLQSAVRNDDGSAGQDRQRRITGMADRVLRSVGIDPTPRPDAAPGSDAAQAEQFHRTLQDDLSAFESKGRPPTETEAYAIVNGLKDTAIKSGWLKVSDPSMPSSILPADDAGPKDSVRLAQAGQEHDAWSRLDRQSDRLAGAADDEHGGPRETDSDESGAGYQIAQKAAESPDGRSGVAPLTEPPSNDPDFIKALETWPGVPVVLPNGKHIDDPTSPTDYVMAPFPRLESVVKAARRAKTEIMINAAINPTTAWVSITRMLYGVLKRNVAQGGDFDYQRQANKNQRDGYVQLRQFRNVSNVNVGLFCQQIGLPRVLTLIIAGIYARRKSGNARPDQPYGLHPDTKKYIDVGYDLGESGLFD